MFFFEFLLAGWQQRARFHTQLHTTPRTKLALGATGNALFFLRAQSGVSGEPEDVETFPNGAFSAAASQE